MDSHSTVDVTAREAVKWKLQEDHDMNPVDSSNLDNPHLQSCFH